MLSTFDTFRTELAALVSQFDRHYPLYTSPDYNEQTLRADFLDRFFRALGWDVGNTKGLIITEREVDIEVRTALSGKQTRADYVFRIDKVERFTCEAKKPSEALHEKHIYQAKRDAFARGIPVAILSDFEDTKIYIVGARPHIDDPHTGEFKVINFRQFNDAAKELWDLLSYESVKAGSIDRLIDSLPKRPMRLKGRQGWLIKPDKNKSLDSDFLNFLDRARQALGSDLLIMNDREDLLVGHRLNEAAQRIIDRLIFLRICEDRGIDTGILLSTVFNDWIRNQHNPPKLKSVSRQTQLALSTKHEERKEERIKLTEEGSLYAEVIEHIQSLDQRPPSYKPFFNGQLFKPHFSEGLKVGNEWLANFIQDLCDEGAGYNFADIKVEILGDAYERFLGKMLLPQGRGAKIEDKPEVRKAGGVYYTPQYVTDFIVEETVGKLVEGKTPKAVEKFKILDPACGSGSFLLRAYERIMEYYLRWYTNNPSRRKSADYYLDSANNVRLTTALKRRILTNNIYGVDIDPQAVEVTQLSLYLKMLEGENRDSLRSQSELFKKDPLLPPLQQNIKCFNSLISSDFSSDTSELIRVNAGDWDVHFEAICETGGFDAVIGNPPYVLLQNMENDHGFDYLSRTYQSARYKIDTYHLFMERAIKLAKNQGYFGFITPNTYLLNQHAEQIRRFVLKNTDVKTLRVFYYPVFNGASVDTCILIARRVKPGTERAEEIEVIASKSKNECNRYTIKRQDWTKHPTNNFAIVESRNAVALKNKIAENSQPLGQVATAYFGIQTHNRTKYVSTEKRTTDYQPAVDGANVLPFSVLPHREYVDFRKAAIKSGGNPCVYAIDRIAIRQIGKTPIAAWIKSHTYTLNTIYNVFFVKPAKFDLKAVLGLMMSDLIQWYWVQVYFDQKGRFPKIKKPAILGIPIAKKLFEEQAKETHDKLVAVVDKLISCRTAIQRPTSPAEEETVRNAVEKCRKDLNGLVCQLYEITPDDFKLIQDGMKDSRVW